MFPGTHFTKHIVQMSRLFVQSTRKINKLSRLTSVCLYGMLEQVVKFLIGFWSCELYISFSFPASLVVQWLPEKPADLDLHCFQNRIGRFQKVMCIVGRVGL